MKFFLRLAILGLFIAALCGCGRQKKNEAPDFTLPVYGSDQKINLREINRDHPVLLAFWATWCPACVEEVPKLNQWQKEFGGQGLKILSIDVQESPDAIKKFKQSSAVDYPVLLDEDGKVSNAYGLVGLPVSIFLNKGGEVLYYGFSLPPDLAKYLEKGEPQR